MNFKKAAQSLFCTVLLLCCLSCGKERLATPPPSNKTELPPKEGNAHFDLSLPQLISAFHKQINGNQDLLSLENPTVTQHDTTHNSYFYHLKDGYSILIYTSQPSEKVQSIYIKSRTDNPNDAAQATCAMFMTFSVAAIESEQNLTLLEETGISHASNASGKPVYGKHSSIVYQLEAETKSYIFFMQAK